MKSDDSSFFRDERQDRDREGGRETRRGQKRAPREPGSGKSEPGSGARLDSWEEIAAYLRRSVRSARRWEKAEGLPVHREVLSGGGSVYAYKEELDDWFMSDAKTEPGPSDRLDSWKEIAIYLRSSVRSMRRWEKEEGLPVRRHVHDKGDSVYAFRTELKDWLNSRGARESGQERLGKLH